MNKYASEVMQIVQAYSDNPGITYEQLRLNSLNVANALNELPSFELRKLGVDRLRVDLFVLSNNLTRFFAADSITAEDYFHGQVELGRETALRSTGFVLGMLRQER